MKTFALVTVILVALLAACAPQVTPEEFRIREVVVPRMVSFGEVGSGRISYTGTPAFPLTVRTRNVSCSIADRCREGEFMVGENMVQDNTFVFRYRCAAEGERSLEAIDDVVITDANGVSTPAARYIVRCMP